MACSLHLSVACLTITLVPLGLGCESDPTSREPEVSAVPPARVVDAPPGDGAGVRLGVSRFQLGWEQWDENGYDLDGVITRTLLDAHCQAQPFASSADVLIDGPGGVDNNFARVMLPLLSFLACYEVDDCVLERQVNESLGSGSDGLLIELRDLGTQSDYGSISASAFGLRTQNADGQWLLAPESLGEPSESSIDDALKAGLVSFSESYVTKNVWVGRGSDGVIELSWLLGGSSLILRVQQPLVAVDVSKAQDGTASGVLAGVLDAQETMTALHRWLAGVSPGYCDGPIIAGVLAQFAQAADVMKNGSHDTALACDAISFGLGFDASLVEVAAVGEARESLDTCADP